MHNTVYKAEEIECRVQPVSLLFSDVIRIDVRDNTWSQDGGNRRENVDKPFHRSRKLWITDNVQAS